ncbi:hypothetical protein ACFORG_09235 [Lutimaribacter marinistellae]|uniref:Uncharacterized protein n=1 Tax=Lutimaribacter marinistellae TaxID=1820329 RepID=A0ABV7TFC5_9RHOB
MARAASDPATPHTLASDTDFGPYFLVADSALRLFSVFDDLRFDRADADMLSGPMRRHAVERLGRFGFRQVSGTVLEQAETGARAIMPKWHALGASPFDIARYTPRRAEDWYILTPTQTACQFIDAYPTDEAVDRIKALVVRQPINLLRIMDFLERRPEHDAFRAAIGHLKYVQREAVESEPLRRRRALR